MATTIVEWEEVPDSPVYRTKIVKDLKAAYEEDQKNDDKCGSVDDCSYYCGRMDALHDLLYTFGWRVKDREVEAKPCTHNYAFVEDLHGKLLCTGCDEQVSLYAENGMVQYRFDHKVRQYYLVDLDTSEKTATQLNCEHLVLKVTGSQNHRGLANVCEACGYEIPERRPGEPILHWWDTQSRRYIKITEEKNSG